MAIHNKEPTKFMQQNLIVTQIIKKFPAFYETPKVHYHVHRGLPQVHILCQMNPINF